MTSEWNNNPLFNTDGIISKNNKGQELYEPLYDNLIPLDNYNHLSRDNKNNKDS